jgi:hypothetical protein
VTATAKRILDDFRHRRNVDLYATALVAFVFAVLTLIGADLPNGIRWSLVFAALGLLVLRSAVAVSPSSPVEEAFLDRTAYVANPIADDLLTAKEVWIFAPTAANFLTAERCELLRKGPLNRADGSVRVVVLDESDPGRLEMLAEQLDQLLDFPVQEVTDDLRQTHQRLRAMAGWRLNGTFAYGTLPFSPGFSIVAIDPASAGGHVIVEFHGFHNDTITSRMHIRLTRANLRWYLYWLDQFDAIWRAATPVSARQAMPGSAET